MTVESNLIFLICWVCFIWILNAGTKPLARQEIAALLFPIVVVCIVLLGVLARGEP